MAVEVKGSYLTQAQMDFELALNDVTFQHVINYAMRTTPKNLVLSFSSLFSSWKTRLLKAAWKLSKVSISVDWVREFSTIFCHCRWRGYSCVLEFKIRSVLKEFFQWACSSQADRKMVESNRNRIKLVETLDSF